MSLTILAACSATMPPGPKIYSDSLPAAQSGDLAQVSKALKQRRQNASDSVMVISTAQMALEARMALLENTASSLDIQYAQWSGDESGLLLFDTLFAAAERGVRVRLLVNSFNASAAGMSEARIAAAAASHPNISIRFSPDDFSGNNLIVADSHFALLGSRQVANEYFGLNEATNQLALDVLVNGNAVGQAATGFDLVWNSPATTVSGSDPDTEQLESLLKQNRDALTEQVALLQRYHYQQGRWVRVLFSWVDRMSPGSVAYWQDQPLENQPVTAGLQVSLTEDIQLGEEPSSFVRSLVDVYPVVSRSVGLKAFASSDEGSECMVGSGNLPGGPEKTANGMYIKSDEVCGQLTDLFARLRSEENVMAN